MTGPSRAMMLLAGLSLAWSLWGCAKTPVLRADEAVPASIEDLDEATDLVSRRHLSNFKLCVQRSQLVDDASLSGKPMDLAFSITPKGEATNVRMLSPRFAGSAFSSCVQRILTWIRFPSPGDDSRQVRLRLYLNEEQPLRR